MPLSPDQLPLPRSVRDRVRERFAADSPRPGADTLSHADIIAFLAKSMDTDSSPLATIRRRAAKVGRAADLEPNDHATLVWIAEAFGDWEESYPLESPLREHLRKLLPLAVAVALSDESFFDVGAHPLHRLLDTLQEGSVGWQARLDRAGQMLEQRVERSVEKALEWFNDPSVNFRAITSELEGANDRDYSRAQRMIQRLEETEAARLMTLHARRKAAAGINEGFQEFELPAAIGDFLKGAWFESAQMVIVKHGENSREWRDMLRTTRNLMESVQTTDGFDDDAREHRKQLLRRLPGELRRWMLSLEHDSDAIDGAIGLVEYAHLRLAHGQTLDMVIMDPLPDGEDDDSPLFAGERLETGQWYHFADGDVRAQLVLQMDNGNHLLFTNFVGLKAVELTQKGFRNQREDGSATLLPNRSTFSLSLAAAAGVYSDDTLRALVDPSFEPPVPRPDIAAGAGNGPQDSGPERDAYPGSAPESDDLQHPQGPEPGYGERDAGAPDDSWQGSPGQPGEPSAQPGEPSAQPGEPSAQPGEPSAYPGEPSAQPAGTPPPQPSPQPVQQPPQPTAPTEYPEQPAASAPQPTPYSEPQAPPVAPEPPPEPSSAPATPGWSSPAPAQPTAAPETAPPAPAPEPAPSEAAPEADADVEKTEVDIPMGSWLGFHDGETPMMAKLAVYDPRRDNYILVNRKGIAMRELSGADLVRLMKDGLVDILETRSYFRDEVQRAREEDR